MLGALPLAMIRLKPPQSDRCFKLANVRQTFRSIYETIRKYFVDDLALGVGPGIDYYLEIPGTEIIEH